MTDITDLTPAQIGALRWIHKNDHTSSQMAGARGSAFEIRGPSASYQMAWDDFVAIRPHLMDGLSSIDGLPPFKDAEGNQTRVWRVAPETVAALELGQ